ncbi:hypothetical protein [Saliphagus sp. LR7]|uniref:hypothetical protein n=1 Tax=Saliphagus sp. LR7 TaxID=2282654 RepID=UPI000DF7ADC9|nr:hypothetical protein [Saliphagus sp. LR7]
MNSFSNPESLRDQAGVPFDEEIQQLPPEEFESVSESVDSHAVVGITNEDGDVLLMDDGSHGWTLIAFPVERGQDWPTVAREEAQTLLDTSVVLEQPELVRRIDFLPVNDDNRRTTMYNVVFRASVDETIDTEELDQQNDEPLLRWFERVPDEQEGEVADDIRIFVGN